MENMNIEGMLGRMDLSQVEKNVVALHQTRRLPAVLLEHTSGSVSKYDDLLKHSVLCLYDGIL